MCQSHHRRDNCRLCGGLDLDLGLHLASTPIADDYVTPDRIDESQELFPLDLYRCQRCGHVQLLDVVDPDLLFANYTYRTAVSLGLVEHFRAYAATLVERLATVPGSLVVDIGSNDGTLLRFFKEHGMRVLGVDPAREIAQAATESGVETLPAYFTAELARALRTERGRATIVTANNVFAHADDLGGMTDGVRELLAPDGVFVFEVSYLVDIVQRDLFDTVYHEHLCYHSVKPLERFFRHHGMQLFDIQRIASKGGSIRGFAQRSGGPRPVEASVGGYIAREDELGMDGPEPLRAMGRRIEKNRRALLRRLADFRSHSRTVAGYGASATVTTLLYHFELEHLLEFIVDDNPRKHGTFSPGSHLPVYPSDALFDRGANDVVVLAWAYANPIINKHQRFLQQGGRFIVPMPCVRVVIAHD